MKKSMPFHSAMLSKRQIWLLLSPLLFTFKANAHIRNYCSTKNLPIALLERNSNGGYRIVRRWPTSQLSEIDSSLGGFRRLEASDYYQHRSIDVNDNDIDDDVSAVSGLRVLHGENEENSSISTTDAHYSNQSHWNHTNLYFARECTCFSELANNSIFCPFAVSTCRQFIDNHGGLPHPQSIKCYNEGLDEDTFLHLWLSIYCFYGLVLGCIFLTHKGRSCLSYIPSLILKNWNELVATHLLRRRPEFARKLICNYIQVRQEQQRRAAFRQVAPGRRRRGGEQRDGDYGDDIDNDIQLIAMSAKPTSLALKTRRYHTSDHNVENQESCIICFVDLNEGDRVGVLPTCEHVFHADCLKGWLRRKNSCPLCQQENVAEPRYD